MKSKNILFIFILAGPFCSCKKDWLDAKPDISLVIPAAIGDYQKVLDNSGVFNNIYAGLGEISSDDYYITDNSWQSLSSTPQKNAYIWATDIYQGDNSLIDWPGPYQQVFNANIALEGIRNIVHNASNLADWNNVYASALFYRAFAFYNLAQLFTKPYDSATASSDLGIPLRLSSDVKQKVTRSSLKQSYEQIIADLLNAASLLPTTPLYKTRPSKPAAFALLARTYLAMAEYDKALLYSDSSLTLTNLLIDYNSLNPSLGNPIPRLNNNNETIFHVRFLYSIFYPNTLIVDSSLYRSYDSNDLRKIVFFKNNSGVPRYKGSYDHSLFLFGGIATDELFLIRAECYARKGAIDLAMSDLNTLLKNRWITGTFIPFVAADATEALKIILTERRKELLFRGLRWSDLRRLNKDPRFAVSLSRLLNGQVATLIPNDSRYVLPIPQNEINIDNIQQNPR